MELKEALKLDIKSMREMKKSELHQVVKELKVDEFRTTIALNTRQLSDNQAKKKLRRVIARAKTVLLENTGA